MGYTKTATECSGKDFLRCPFDTSTYFCSETCDFSNYPLSSCPANGVCTNYTCNGLTKYKLDSCNSCYFVSGNSCVSTDCCGYNYTDETLDEGENKCYNMEVINGYLYGCYIDSCYSSILGEYFYKVTAEAYCRYSYEYIYLYDEDIVDTYTCPEQELSYQYVCACKKACDEAGGYYSSETCSESCYGLMTPFFNKEDFCMYGCAEYDMCGNCKLCSYDPACDYENSINIKYGLTSAGVDLQISAELNAYPDMYRSCHPSMCNADGSYGMYCYYS